MTWRFFGVSVAMAVGCTLAVGCGGKSREGGAGGTAGTGGVGANGGSGGVGANGGSGGVGANGGSGGGPNACASAPTPCIVPPPPSSVPPNAGGTRTVIAIQHFYIGDTDPNGQPDPNAWKRYGYNLDGLVSTAHDLNHCMPVPGANPADVKTDGDGGIDNSFGENLVPLYSSLASDLTASINQSIADGKGTQLIELDNLVDPAKSPNQNGISAARYVGANMGSPAWFTGSDVWPVTYESVAGGNINSPLVVFPKSYVSGGVWVSGNSSSFVLDLSFPFLSTLPLSRAVITMRVKGSGKTASAVDGIIAGVMNTQSYIAMLKKIAGSIDTSLCDGPTFDSIAQQLLAASDIMSNGTNGDPDKTCDAISVGIGFDGFAAQLGAVAPPVQPTPDPCAP